jgi:hypothetical protein
MVEFATIAAAEFLFVTTVQKKMKVRIFLYLLPARMRVQDAAPLAIPRKDRCPQQNKKMRQLSMVIIYIL